MMNPTKVPVAVALASLALVAVYVGTRLSQYSVLAPRSTGWDFAANPWAIAAAQAGGFVAGVALTIMVVVLRRR